MHGHVVGTARWRRSRIALIQASIVKFEAVFITLIGRRMITFGVYRENNAQGGMRFAFPPYGPLIKRLTIPSAPYIVAFARPTLGTNIPFAIVTFFIRIPHSLMAFVAKVFTALVSCSRLLVFPGIRYPNKI